MTMQSPSRYRTERGIQYAEADGEPLRMTMYVPERRDSVLRPGMVLIHGGGWIIGTRYQQAWYCRNFAKAGYVVMTIDYRLMPRSAFPCCLHDCKAAVRWLRANASRYNVDVKRIVTFGASAGGHLATMLALTERESFEGLCNPGESSEVQAAISLYGAVDLTMYRDNPLHGRLSHLTSNFLQDFTTRTLGHQNGQSFEVASAVTYASASSKPILLVHGTKDHVVHYEQSARLYRRLLEVGAPVELITVEGRGHGFDYIYTRQRREIFEKMLDFLRRYGCEPRFQSINR